MNDELKDELTDIHTAIKLLYHYLGLQTIPGDSKESEWGALKTRKTADLEIGETIDYRGNIKHY